MDAFAFRDELREAILQRLDSLDPGNRLSQSQIHDLISNLPRLTEKQVVDLGQKDSICPICLTPFTALLAEEELAYAMESPANPAESMGVARLAQCGHLFCRRDISRWIHESHDSCPTCRRHLLEHSPTSSQPSSPTPTREVPVMNLDTLPSEIRDAISRLNNQLPGLFSSLLGDNGHDARDAISPVEISELNAFLRNSAPPRSINEREQYSGMYS